MKCPICGNDANNKEFLVKELQFGLREEFEYIECSECGCLFIKEIPENLSKYYGSDYAPHNNKFTFKNKLVNKFIGLYLANNFFVSLFSPKDKIPPIAKLLNKLVSENIISKNSSILDVGCGDGNFLNYFKQGGFKDLTGIDLFIDDENMIPGINIVQTSLEDFKTTKKFDLIISNHAFEHMDNQLVNFKCLENLVNENGLILLRIPVKSKFVWEKFGVNWYQIDAPRHLFLHTLESFKVLCDKTNLEIQDEIFDSSHLLFTFSEKYSQNISPRDEKWQLVSFDNKIEEYKHQIKVLNENKNSDQAIFILNLKR